MTSQSHLEEKGDMGQESGEFQPVKNGMKVELVTHPVFTGQTKPGLHASQLEMKEVKFLI